MFTLMVSTEKLKIYLMTFSLSTIRPSKLSRSTLDSWFIEKTSFNTSVTECIGHGSKFLSIFIWKFYFVFIRSIENCGSYDKDYKLNRYYFDEKKKVGLSATFFQKWKKNIYDQFLQFQWVSVGTMPWKGIKPLRISKFYMQICPSENSIGYVVLTLIKLLSQ